MLALVFSCYKQQATTDEGAGETPIAAARHFAGMSAGFSSPGGLTHPLI
jgi:hypothetical protein